MSVESLPDKGLVKAWMSPPEHAVSPTTTVDEAFAVMKREAIHHLLVTTDGDDLVGIVTDRDLRNPEFSGGDPTQVTKMYKLGKKLKVSDVMTEDLVTAEESVSTSDAARLMVENRFNCLPVTRGQKVVGILTSTDLLAALVGVAGEDA